jgi:hypothetical protein
MSAPPTSSALPGVELIETKQAPVAPLWTGTTRTRKEPNEMPAPSTAFAAGDQR